MSEKLIAPDPETIKAMEPEKLLKQFERLIIKVGNRYSKTASLYGWIDTDDLYQIAAIGILKAQKTFDPESEASFVSYACNCMTWDIMNALKIRKTPEGWKKSPVPLSLDEPINEEAEDTIGDLIPARETPIDEQAEINEVVSRVRAAVGSLPDDEEEIIERIYLQDPPEQRSQIAEEKGISGQAISNRERKAFRRLREDLSDLKEYRPHHIGASEYNTTWTSEPELYAIKREKRLAQLEESYRQFIRVRTGREI